MTNDKRDIAGAFQRAKFMAESDHAAGTEIFVVFKASIGCERVPHSLTDADSFAELGSVLPGAVYRGTPESHLATFREPVRSHRTECTDMCLARSQE